MTSVITSTARRAVLATIMLAATLALAGNARADLALTSFSTTASTSQAGAPVDLVTDFDVALVDNGSGPGVTGSIKDLSVELPPGLVGDTTAVPRCKQMLSLQGCPAASQVGTLTANLMFGPTPFPWPAPLYLLEPSDGKTAELGALFFFGPVYLNVRVRTEGDYGLTTEMENALSTFPVAGARVELWGVPAEHNNSGAPPDVFLRNPAQCSGERTTRLTTNSWQHPDRVVEATSSLPATTGCGELPAVHPALAVTPDDTSAGAPAGYTIDLAIPQAGSRAPIASPPLNEVAIDLPPGTAISPGSVDGLAACTDQQLHEHDREAVGCPDASKIGTASITTPFLAEPLTGAMYLGEPTPREQFRLFLVAEGSGVSVRVKGSAVPDPATGRLRTVFRNLPPLAFSRLQVHLKGGPRAVLVNPTACGPASATTAVTPIGGGAPGSASTSFDVTGDCAPKGFSPELTAGTTTAVAGAESPFVLQVRRADNQQDLKAISVDLPAGLIGKEAGIPLCPTAAAIAGTCAESARVGSVSVGVGTGSNPISLPGRAYLTEGYGGPLGLAFVVPAKIGPFDFGTVVVRAKVQIDAFTGALHVETDEMPQIIAGIPLHYRAITVNLDRPGFMRNPTSCAEQQVRASLSATGGAAATATTRFQVAGCGDLKLAPKLKMTLNGKTERKRSGKPGLSFGLTQRPGQSNLKTVKVTLPKDISIALGLPTPCTVAQFTARACPAASKIGDSSVTTPLLSGALQGGVYLVTGEKAELPRLGVLLEGLVPISLLSRVTVSKGRVVTTFTAPDLPISAFKLTLNTKTALSATRSLCDRKQRANVAITGASGAVKKSTVTVPAQGCPNRRRAR